MMNSPLVSIVMAAYNEEKHIRGAIGSVLAQTYPHFEFIIINDGSTDATEAIIHSYGDPRIRYVKNERNLKLIDSLNKGLSMATGKYIARMDADDICMENRLEKQVAFMEAHPETGISGAQLAMFGSVEGRMQYPLTHEEIKVRLLVTSCFGNNVVIFRRSIMEEHGLFFPKGYLHAEDYKCWTCWIMHTQAANMDEELVRYRTHSDSVSVQNRTLQRATRNRIRAEYACALFGLPAGSALASDLTGPVSARRTGAIKKILELNSEKKIVDPLLLKQALAQLWYSDCLEKAEHGFFVFFKYPLIFKVTSAGQFRRWITVLKHYLKLRTGKHK